VTIRTRSKLRRPSSESTRSAETAPGIGPRALAIPAAGDLIDKESRMTTTAAGSGTLHALANSTQLKTTYINVLED
jgi:hypothetical protein